METSLATKVYASPTVINQHGRVIYNDQTGKLVGIEVGVFSYKVPESQFDTIIEDICGRNFRFQSLQEGRTGERSYFIAPKEHCLVEGGMMYTSAITILKELNSSGLLVAEYRAINAE